MHCTCCGRWLWIPSAYDVDEDDIKFCIPCGRQLVADAELPADQVLALPPLYREMVYLFIDDPGLPPGHWARPDELPTSDRWS